MNRSRTTQAVMAWVVYGVLLITICGCDRWELPQKPQTLRGVSPVSIAE